jgi:phage terminase large subunit-like protein
MRERQAYVARKQFPTVRAQSIRGRMELDGLYVPTQAHWYPAFLSELLNFPAGKHDDQVDALGLIGQILDRMNKGAAPPKTDQEIRFLNGLTMARGVGAGEAKAAGLGREDLTYHYRI